MTKKIGSCKNHTRSHIRVHKPHPIPDQTMGGGGGGRGGERHVPICMIWPALLSIRFPLCLSLICSRKLTMEYAAMLLIKFARA